MWCGGGGCVEHYYDLKIFRLTLSSRGLSFGAGLGVASDSGGETGTCTFVAFGERDFLHF
jgi:hypothetical protein